MFSVHLSKLAEDGLNAIMDYLLSQDADSATLELWENFEDAFNSLREFPSRGHLPPELHEYPDKHIREIHVGVYRVIYRIRNNEVFVLFIADSRRDIQKLLLDRALVFGL
ncbi:MAG: type II toxin-antitoxin system RelE/ParE family toxin [Desulfovibrio sp.]|jgi:toxin ParE1/3/4|nr:type II toxin-antitoxin system RelE/ParE family toxin [Desulfovibrio sp.]